MQQYLKFSTLQDPCMLCGGCALYVFLGSIFCNY